MANRKWLNIIVDGNSALGPHWPNIVSEYLEHIVRSFCGNSREQGNNDSPLANTPISNCRIDQFTVLLSRNFKEAHDALREKRTVDPPITESVESRKRTMDIRLPIDFANDRQAGNMASTEKQINEAAKDNRLAQTSTAGDSNGPVQEVGGSSSPLLPYASSNSSSSSRQHVPYQMSGFDPLGRPALRPSTWVPPVPITQFNPSDFWPPPPSLTDFRDYARAWEGSLVGKIHRNRTSLHTAKALIRRATSPSLTIEWSSRLEIALYVPKKALDHTIKFCCGPIDYVFFRILQFNNLDLSDHLMSKNLCAKIHLPSQILILSPTESKYHYIGIVFPGCLFTIYHFVLLSTNKINRNVNESIVSPKYRGIGEPYTSKLADALP
ncbi:Mediator of RNA polymerase II transcription subunit 25 [Spatholobus suberectus]|nr:Mediator of RNA polymerase II transcription subunit 25 [Spatholobus suberectus]